MLPPSWSPLVTLSALDSSRQEITVILLLLRTIIWRVVSSRDPPVLDRTVVNSSRNPARERVLVLLAKKMVKISSSLLNLVRMRSSLQITRNSPLLPKLIAENARTPRVSKDMLRIFRDLKAPVSRLSLMPSLKDLPKMARTTKVKSLRDSNLRAKDLKDNNLRDSSHLASNLRAKNQRGSNLKVSKPRMDNSLKAKSPREVSNLRVNLKASNLRANKPRTSNLKSNKLRAKDLKDNNLRDSSHLANKPRAKMAKSLRALLLNLKLASPRATRLSPLNLKS